MKTFRLIVILLIITVVVILCAGCTSSTLPAVEVTTAPIATAIPTSVPTVITCGVENCHGLTVTCGSNPATVCTSDLNEGDRCRQYASCQVVSGSCQLVTESKFDKCINCVKNCQNSFPNNPNQVLDCSQSC